MYSRTVQTKREHLSGQDAFVNTPSTKAPPLGTAIKPKVSGEDWIMRAVLIGIALYLLITMVFPLYAILSKSFQTDKGVFIGLDNYIKFFSTPALFWSIQNSFFVTIITSIPVKHVVSTKHTGIQINITIQIKIRKSGRCSTVPLVTDNPTFQSLVRKIVTFVTIQRIVLTAKLRNI